jgi:hypothetical protein
MSQPVGRWKRPIVVEPVVEIIIGTARTCFHCQTDLPEILRRGAVGVSLALLFLRKLLKVLGCLKQLLTGLVDRDLLDNGPDFLRLPAILGSSIKSIDRHD